MERLHHITLRLVRRYAFNWTWHKQCYTGTVIGTRVSHESKPEHHISYDDGDRHWHDLDTETWGLVDASIDATVAELHATRVRAATLVDREHRKLQHQDMTARMLRERVETVLAESAMHVVYGVDCCFHVTPDAHLWTAGPLP